MADLIDRQKIKARFEPWLKVKGYSEGELNMLKAVLYEITIMPSAQTDVSDTNVGDMISRQAAIDAVRSYYDECDEREESIEERIERLPSADVQPVRHGHWILQENQNQDDVNNGNYLYICSNCKHSDIHARTVDVPYCWHCGALMDEVAQ